MRCPISIPGGNSTMAKILVVEDDRELYDFLQEALAARGHETQWAGNGQQGVELYLKDHFDLIISDIRMPERDGLSMLTEIRQYDKKIPVIIATAYPSVSSAVSALTRGADYYLIKPIKINDLDAKVNKCLEKIDLYAQFTRLSAYNLRLKIAIPLALVLGFILARII